MVLICLFLCRSVSLSLFFFPSSSSAYAPILISISSIVLRLISSSLFPSRLHPLPVFQSRRVPPALALPHLFFFPFLVLFQPLNLARPRPSFSFSFSFSSGLYFSAPDVPPVANIVFLPPPLDMAKEAICALLAILEHFFEAFSSIDLFFALAPFRPASSASPCFPPSRSFIDSNLFHLPPVRSSQHHPGLVPIPLGDIRPCCLHLPSFCRLVSPRLSTPAPSCLSLQPLQRLRLPVSAAPSTPASPVSPVHPCQPLPAPRRAHQGRFHSPR